MNHSTKFEILIPKTQVSQKRFELMTFDTHHTIQKIRRSAEFNWGHSSSTKEFLVKHSCVEFSRSGYKTQTFFQGKPSSDWSSAPGQFQPQILPSSKLVPTLVAHHTLDTSPENPRPAGSAADVPGQPTLAAEVIRPAGPWRRSDQRVIPAEETKWPAGHSSRVDEVTNGS